MRDSTIEIRTMTELDIPLGMRLKEAAGWNQIEDDWRAMLRHRPRGCFVASINGVDAATGTTARYDSVGWIGMILVDPDHRRRGLATRVMSAAIESFPEAEVTIKLDATPAGREVYEQLGFVAERPLGRWVLPRERASVAPGKRREVVRRIEPCDLDRIEEVDRHVFGGSRRWILEELHRRLPSRAFCIERAGNIEAYCFGRDGSIFDKVGPLIAESEDDAIALLDASMAAFDSSLPASSSARDFAIDVLDPTPSWELALRERGFERERVLTRMHLGPNESPGRPELQWTIVGYDLG